MNQEDDQNEQVNEQSISYIDPIVMKEF